MTYSPAQMTTSLEVLMCCMFGLQHIRLCLNVNLIAEQYIPLRDLNAVTRVGPLLPDRKRRRVAHGVPARIERWRRGEYVAKVAALTESAA